MNIEGSTAFITGANRGIGRHFATQLLERGATKVYAAARNPASIDVPGVTPVALDIKDPAAVAAAAALAGDVTFLVNNAGVSHYAGLVAGELDALRDEMETNYFGTLQMVRAFAPVLGANGGGAILNVASRLSWLTYPGAGGYSASKAAVWSLTEGVRLDLAGQGTHVAGLYLSGTDTDMMAGWDIPKNDPADVVRTALDGIEAGKLEILADDDTVATKRGLSLDPSEIYAELLSSGAAA